MGMFCFLHETPISVMKYGLHGLQATRFGKQEQRWGTIGNKIGFAEQKQALNEQAPGGREVSGGGAPKGERAGSLWSIPQLLYDHYPSLIVVKQCTIEKGGKHSV